MSKTDDQPTDTDDVYEPNPTLGDLEPTPDRVWKTPHRGELPTIHLRPPEDCPGIKENENTKAVTDKDPVVLSDFLPVCKLCLEADDCRLLPGVDTVRKKPEESEFTKDLSKVLEDMTVDEFDDQVFGTDRSDDDSGPREVTHPSEQRVELREADSSKFDRDEPWRYVCPACWPDHRRQVTDTKCVSSVWRCPTCEYRADEWELIDLKHGKPRREIDYE